jgi:hypothetical protein
VPSQILGQNQVTVYRYGPQDWYYWNGSKWQSKIDQLKAARGCNWLVIRRYELVEKETYIQANP